MEVNRRRAYGNKEKWDMGFGRTFTWKKCYQSKLGVQDKVP